MREKQADIESAFSGRNCDGKCKYAVRAWMCRHKLNLFLMARKCVATHYAQPGFFVCLWVWHALNHTYFSHLFSSSTSVSVFFNSRQPFFSICGTFTSIICASIFTLSRRLARMKKATTRDIYECYLPDIALYSNCEKTTENLNSWSSVHPLSRKIEFVHEDKMKCLMKIIVASYVTRQSKLILLAGRWVSVAIVSYRSKSRRWNSYIAHISLPKRKTKMMLFIGFVSRYFKKQIYLNVKQYK